MENYSTNNFYYIITHHKIWLMSESIKDLDIEGDRLMIYICMFAYIDNECRMCEWRYR
jgi:hypothetical protein